MSASSALARRAAGRHRFLGRAGSLHPIAIPSYLSARPAGTQLPYPPLALLIPLRRLETDRHRPGVTTSTPPPGFDVSKAKQASSSETGAAVSKSADGKQGQPTPAQPQTQTAAGTGNPSRDLVTGNKDEAAAASKEVVKADKEDKKLTLWQKVKKEAQHYWDGTKLLAAEIRISWRLALKMAAGYDLTRREHKQLRRTLQDLVRLVPFSVFIIVPLGEALLPLALKLFPNMLPSTFEGQKSKEAKATILRSTRNEVSSFLRQTLKESGLPLSPATAQREEFTNFFRKVRSTGETPTNEDVIKVCKVFRDDLTLDNLSRPQLVSMCRYMNLNTFGTDMMLRYQIRHRMRQIKRDDKAISFEGVDSLTTAELQMACAARGIRTHSVSPAQMRSDLQTWLDLRLKEGVPSTLLVLSNAYMYGQGSDEGSNQIEALVGVMSSIPEELFHEIELEVHNAEGAATNKQRLEVLKEQQDLIEEENEQKEESESTGMATPRDVDDIDEEKEERQATAEAAHLEKSPAAEMLEAEREQANVTSAGASTTTTATKKDEGSK